MEKSKKPKVTRRDLLRWMSLGAASSVLPVAYGTLSTGWISVERHEIALPHWDADGFRVVVLSDLHTNIDEEVDRAKIAVRMALDEKPDLIAMPGDFVNAGHESFLARVRKSLEALHEAKCPVVASLGNHDYFSRNVPGVVAAVQTSSAIVLRNQAIEVAGVTVAGVDDAIAGENRTEFLAGSSFSKSLLTLMHEPDYVDTMPGHVSLQLSGHSHGGQICLPGGIPLHTPRGAWKYWAGYYPDAKVPLYVTRGIGTVGPRWRLFCRPEITVLTLRSA